MKNFASVLRSLLVRIRAFEASRSGSPWPPSAATGGESSLYRVAPTAWGVQPASVPETEPTAAATPGAERVAARRVPARKRRHLEIPVFSLPVPRGLPAT